MSSNKGSKGSSTPTPRATAPAPEPVATERIAPMVAEPVEPGATEPMPGPVITGVVTIPPRQPPPVVVEGQTMLALGHAQRALDEATRLSREAHQLSADVRAQRKAVAAENPPPEKPPKKAPSAPAAARAPVDAKKAPADLTELTKGKLVGRSRLLHAARDLNLDVMKLTGRTVEDLNRAVGAAPDAIGAAPEKPRARVRRGLGAVSSKHTPNVEAAATAAGGVRAALSAEKPAARRGIGVGAVSKRKGRAHAQTPTTSDVRFPWDDTEGVPTTRGNG